MMQRAGAAIFGTLFLAACTAPPAVEQPRPDSYNSAARQARKDCGGEAREVSRTALTTQWPFTLRVRTMKQCVATGLIVGPYYYNSAN